MRRRVRDGARSASPRATVRTASVSWAALASLSRKPLAPARSASTTYSSRSKVPSGRRTLAGSLVTSRVCSTCLGSVAPIGAPSPAVGDAPELLDVDMDQLTGGRRLVAHYLRAAHRQSGGLVHVGQQRHPITG